MIGRIAVFVCALTLLAVTGVLAQEVVTGTVVRIDQPAGVVVLDNGQMYQVTRESVILVNGQPAAIATVTPGTVVALQSTPAVMLRDGRYVVMTADTPYQVSGVVRFVSSPAEPGRASLTLDDGRHIWIDENTQVLANGAPAMLSTLKPGTFVTVRSAKPFAFRQSSGRAVVVTPEPAAPAVVTYPSAMPGAVYGSASPYPLPSPIGPEMGLREREQERQAP